MDDYKEPEQNPDNQNTDSNPNGRSPQPQDSSGWQQPQPQDNPGWQNPQPQDNPGWQQPQPQDNPGWQNPQNGPWQGWQNPQNGPQNNWQQNQYQQSGPQNSWQQNQYQQNGTPQGWQQNQYQQYNHPKESNGLALASMIVGILALISCCCSPLVQFPLAVTAIVLMILSKKGRPLSGFAVAGLIMAIFAILMSIAMTLLIGLFNSPEYRKILSSPEYQKIYEDIYEDIYDSQNDSQNQ